jgi:hypothetical protein
MRLLPPRDYPPATRPPTVIPAKAGIQRLQSSVAVKPWIPAFAGMTSKSKDRAVRNFIWPAYYPAVIPANADFALLRRSRISSDFVAGAAKVFPRSALHRDGSASHWIPAFAGMTA